MSDQSTPNNDRPPSEEISPAGQFPSPAPPSSEQPFLKDQTIPDKMSWFEKLSLSLNLLAVLAASSAAIFFYFQWQTMEKQLLSLDNSSKRNFSQTDNLIMQSIVQARAMETLAKEAKRTGDISESALKINYTQSETALKQSIDSARLDQRAWLGLGEFKVTQFEKGKPVHINIEIINSGKTPAIDVTQSNNIGWLSVSYYNPAAWKDDIESKSFFKKWFDILKYRTAQSVPPQGRFFMSGGDTILDDSDYDAIKSKKLILYVYGRINYNDIFNRPCYTTFCLYMDYQDTPRLFYCKKYNEIK